MSKLSKLKPHLYLLIPVSVFVLVRLYYSGFYLSDAGNYFYLAYQMLNGHLLYSEIFFANLPFLPIMSVIYFLLSFGNLWIFNFTAVFEIIAIACLIYYLIFSKTKEKVIPLIGTSMFLFSSLTSMISSAQYFVFTACLFALLAYLFIDKKRGVLAGIFLALTFLTKAYFLPVIVAIVVASFVKYKFKFTLTVLISFLITSIAVLLPFVILSGSAMWRDVIIFSLRGESYFEISALLLFFLTHEPLFAILLVCSILFIKRNLFTGILSLSFLLLIFFYKTMQPLYMIMVIPFLCLYLPEFIELVNLFPKRFSKALKLDIQEIVIPILIGILLLFSFGLYGVLKGNVSRVTKMDSILFQVATQKPDYIYGDDSIAPSLAYFTNTRLLDDQDNTDGALFSAGILDAKAMTQEALSTKTIFVVLGYLDDNGGMRTLNPMFDLTAISLAQCTQLGTYSVEGNLPLNRLFLIKCY